MSGEFKSGLSKEGHCDKIIPCNLSNLSNIMFETIFVFVLVEIYNLIKTEHAGGIITSMAQLL